jgi:Uri superfamily endonuclease
MSLPCYAMAGSASNSWKLATCTMPHASSATTTSAALRPPERNASARVCTYQLLIGVSAPTRVRVGHLGDIAFSPGVYVYTGSACRGMESRIARHQSRTKRLRWHIDYLLAAPGVYVVDVRRLVEPECKVCQRTGGSIPVAGFGASDCRAGCGSHLRYFGRTHCPRTVADAAGPTPGGR